MGPIVPISGRSGGYSLLAPGSAAIGAGSSTHCLSRDQRNSSLYTRSSSACDIGAIKYIAPATINVDSGCTLGQAITSANTNFTASGSTCEPDGYGGRIELDKNTTLTGSLPDIVSPMTIDGNGYTVTGGGSGSDFDFATISGSNAINVRIEALTIDGLPQHDRRGRADHQQQQCRCGHRADGIHRQHQRQRHSRGRRAARAECQEPDRHWQRLHRQQRARRLRRRLRLG